MNYDTASFLFLEEGLTASFHSLSARRASCTKPKNIHRANFVKKGVTASFHSLSARRASSTKPATVRAANRGFFNGRSFNLASGIHFRPLKKPLSSR